MAQRFRTLAFRLIVFLGIPVAAVGFAFGALNARDQADRLVEEVVAGATRLSRSIQSATWHAMRADRRSDAYDVMETMGRRNGIERIRLFDNQGRVAFSTVPGETGTRVGKDSETCAACHGNGRPLARVAEPRLARFLDGDGGRKLGVATAIYNEPACSQAACHAHPADQSVVGVLDVVVDLSSVDAEIESAKRRTLALGLVQMGIVVAVVLATNVLLVARPIRRLIGSTRAIAEMDLDRPVPAGGGAEIAELGQAVDRMRLRLRDVMAERDEARRRLEAKVERSGLQLRDAERRLIQSDRLASLGRLSGIVAHEINNPVSAVHTFSVAMERMVGEDGVPRERAAEFRGHLSQVTRETARVGRIVSDLLKFSRRASPHVAPEDLNVIVERTLSLVRHRLDMGNVRTETELPAGLPLLPCDAGQVEQVVLNLVMNAAEAMPGGGRLRIATGLEEGGGALLLTVEDGGVGIPEEHLSRIFEPFFSTKEAGKAVGLGLAVVYGIVNAHRGTVDVASEVGKGTTFRVRFPLPGGGPAGEGAA